ADFLGDQHRHLPRRGACDDHRLPCCSLSRLRDFLGLHLGTLRASGALYRRLDLLPGRWAHFLGPAPMISVLLYTTYQSWVPVALYLVAANLLAGVFVFFDDKNSNRFH